MHILVYNSHIIIEIIIMFPGIIPMIVVIIIITVNPIATVIIIMVIMVLMVRETPTHLITTIITTIIEITLQEVTIIIEHIDPM